MLETNNTNIQGRWTNFMLHLTPNADALTNIGQNIG